MGKKVGGGGGGKREGAGGGREGAEGGREGGREVPRGGGLGPCTQVEAFKWPKCAPPSSTLL